MAMTKKDTYLVEGMTCSGCERTVSKVLSNVPGVKSAKADLATASVSLEYDPSKVTIDQLKNSLSKVGYKITGSLPTDGKRASSDEAVS
jgi:copper chaperone CopZ